MEKSDFAFKDGGKRPVVKPVPGSAALGTPFSPSRAPMPKFTRTDSLRKSITPLSPQMTSSVKNSSLILKNDSQIFNMNRSKVSPKISPKNFNGKYGSKSSFGSKPINKIDNNLSNENKPYVAPLVKKVSTDKEVNSAQPSPRKSLRLQPDENDKRLPTSDELRLFSVPPAYSAERQNIVAKKFPSKGRDITEPEFPNSSKPGDKRTSISLYNNRNKETEIIGDMEVIIPIDEEKRYSNTQVTPRNIVVEMPNPEQTRPRNSVLDVFSKIKNQFVPETNTNVVKKKREFKTIVEAMVSIEPEDNPTPPVITHKLSESYIQNDEDFPVLNEVGKVLGRTSVQMVKLNDKSYTKQQVLQPQTQPQTQTQTGLEVGNTFKLDEYGLDGHLKWLYGEETQIDIALGPYAKELPLDAVKVDKSYHVCELDPVSQSNMASKFRKWINPIHGRLFIVLTTSFALTGIFFQSLIYNRLNKWENPDCGGVYVESFNLNSMLGPCSKTLDVLGGLVVNELRQGEIIRMFWAMWMHTGFIHIGFNVISQAQLGYMIEPDWGMLRFFLLFFLSGVGGNLAVAVISPCSLTVGSSGGLFGITAASIPYTFENWNNLPTPMFMFIFSLFSLIIGMVLSFTGVTNPWAHIGGFVVGILYTFTTMQACEGCSPEDRLDRYNRMAALPLFRLFMKQDKEWINRQLEEKKRKKMEKRNAKIAEQWRKNQRIRKNALIKQMKIEKNDGEITDSLGIMVDEHGIKRRTDLTILIDRIPIEKIGLKTKIKIYLRSRIRSLREKKCLWTFRILSALLLIFYFIAGSLATFYPPLYWPNPIGVISFSNGATQCGCCYVNEVYTCGSNPEFIKWCDSKGPSAQPERVIFGYDFSEG